MNHASWRVRVARLLTDRLTPGLRSSQESYFARVESLVRPGIRILDVGCGKEFLVNWLRTDLHRRWSASIVDQAVIFGIDPYLPSLRENPSRLGACALADHLPFPSASFDLVTANMVVEHLADPGMVLAEACRVLRPGGAFVFHTPNLHAPPIWLSNILPYALKRMIVPLIEGGRQEEDVFPTLYRMNTREEIVSSVAVAGFQVEQIDHVFTAPFTKMLGPLVIVELLLIKLFRSERFASWRPDLVCILRKPAR